MSEYLSLLCLPASIFHTQTNVHTHKFMQIFEAFESAEVVQGNLVWKIIYSADLNLRFSGGAKSFFYEKCKRQTKVDERYEGIRRKRARKKNRNTFILLVRSDTKQTQSSIKEV